MGAKFYKDTAKSKKIRKRFTQTRSWFRTLKWLACKCARCDAWINLAPSAASCADLIAILAIFRLCPSHLDRRTPFQGRLGSSPRLPAAPGHEALLNCDANSFRTTQPIEDASRNSIPSWLRSFVQLLLPKLLRQQNILPRQPQLRQDARADEALLWNKPNGRSPQALLLLRWWL